MTNRLLLITQDQGVRQKVREACEKLDAQLVQAASLEDAEDVVAASVPDLVLCDYTTFERLKDRWPRVCVLLYAQPGDSEEAIEAIKRGALDYLVSPIAVESLVEHIQSALRISRDIHVPAVYDDPREDTTVQQIVGQSPAMKEVYKLIGLIAPRDVNVLITGESGTGKELVARAILHHSPRKDQPFLAVNCAAIPETLLESELFGHEKGAFTGASIRRIGKFEQCHGGTLFLDEIGDIPLSTQAKLLRVLQDSTVQRLGGTAVIECDVRIIAATHQSLDRLVQERRFRQDLLYRLKVTGISVPPLRDREVDVVLLAHHFVDRYKHDLGVNIQAFAPETLPVLLRYAWPGNVRELENAIKAALVVARGSILRPEFLPDHIRKGAAPRPEDADTPVPVSAESLGEHLRSVAESLVAQPALNGKLHDTATAMIEREIIRICLERTRGQLSPAARMLGISRTTLRKRMERHGIRPTVAVDT